MIVGEPHIQTYVPSSGVGPGVFVISVALFRVFRLDGGLVGIEKTDFLPREAHYEANKHSHVEDIIIFISHIFFMFT